MRRRPSFVPFFLFALVLQSASSFPISPRLTVGEPAPPWQPSYSEPTVFAPSPQASYESTQSQPPTHLQAAKAPASICSAKPFTKMFPLALSETIVADTANAFFGYNLTIRIGGNSSFAEISDKFFTLDEQARYLPGLKAHSIRATDNTLGGDSFLLFRVLSLTVLTYGRLADPAQLPQYKSTVIINDENLTCVDAMVFLDDGYAFLDCFRQSSLISNVFVLLFLANNTRVEIPNQLFVPFSEIRTRKVLTFRPSESGSPHYFLRLYMAEGVNPASADNTYLELWSIPLTDPSKLQLIRVIDRTVLGVPSLRIVDADIYLDDLFLLCLDNGLFRLDLQSSQRIQVLGRYEGAGFTRFSVYSDDLEQQVLLALSTPHSVQEYDWTDLGNPVLLRAYSLMEHSQIKQIFTNPRYLIVQSSANTSNATHPSFQLNYTWIFTKVSRSYRTAFHTINHNSSGVEIEFDRLHDRLFVADEAGVSLFEIDQPRLKLALTEPSKVGTVQTLNILADSVDNITGTNTTCQENLQIRFTQKEDPSIYPTGLSPLPQYAMNFPGQLDLSLDRLFWGPALQFSLRSSLNIQSWVNKVNETRVVFEPPLPPGEIAFFHTDVTDLQGRESVVYFMQDLYNRTRVATCGHAWFAREMRCRIERTYEHTSRIIAFASAEFITDEDLFPTFYYAFVLAGNRPDLETPNVVQVYNFATQMLAFRITFESGYEGLVDSLATSNGYLYVVRRLAKSITAYDLRHCGSQCPPHFTLNSGIMSQLGVKYFSPEEALTVAAHPEVIFVRCVGVVVIVDVDNPKKPILLKQLVDPVTQTRYYRMVVCQDRLVLAAAPDMLYEYNIERLYRNDPVSFIKFLPLYGHRLQPLADLEFSDGSSTLYVNAISPNNTSSVLIYRLPRPASDALFAVIPLPRLYSRPGFEVEVSGSPVDFLTIVANDQLLCFRVFEQPFATFNSSFLDFEFFIAGASLNGSLKTNNIKVSIANFPERIIPTADFDASLLKASAAGKLEWEDRKWFNGSIGNYSAACPECGGKVRLRNHIDRFERSSLAANSFVSTSRGGFSVNRDLYRHRLNGSVWEVLLLPDQDPSETCSRVASSSDGLYTVTACNNRDSTAHLYITSAASYKAFTWGPLKTDANKIQHLQLVRDIIAVVDVPDHPEYFFRQGSVFLYGADFGASDDHLVLLEELDSKDFASCEGWARDDAFLAGARLVFSPNTEAFRLYVTEVRGGLFVVDFTRVRNAAEVTVLSVVYIDLRTTLFNSGVSVPVETAFLGVNFVGGKANPHLDVENVVVTTKGSHNFEISLIWNDKGELMSTLLHRVYYRYGFYEADAEVEVEAGLLAVSYSLSEFYASSPYPRRYVALYDALDYPHESEKGYSERRVLGAWPLNASLVVHMSFNSTYDSDSEGRRSGLIIAQPSDNTFNARSSLFSVSVGHNLSLDLSPGYSSQTLSITAQNDVSSYSFKVDILAEEMDDTVVFYIVVVLSSVVLISFFIYLCRVVYKKRRTGELPRDSLLTGNEASVLEPANASEVLSLTSPHAQPPQGQPVEHNRGNTHKEASSLRGSKSEAAGGVRRPQSSVFSRSSSRKSVKSYQPVDQVKQDPNAYQAKQDQHVLQHSKDALASPAPPTPKQSTPAKAPRVDAPLRGQTPKSVNIPYETRSQGRPRSPSELSASSLPSPSHDSPALESPHLGLSSKQYANAAIGKIFHKSKSPVSPEPDFNSVQSNLSSQTDQQSLKDDYFNPQEPEDVLIEEPHQHSERVLESEKGASPSQPSLFPQPQLDKSLSERGVKDKPAKEVVAQTNMTSQFPSSESKEKPSQSPTNRSSQRQLNVENTGPKDALVFERNVNPIPLISSPKEGDALSQPVQKDATLSEREYPKIEKEGQTIQTSDPKKAHPAKHLRSPDLPEKEAPQGSEGAAQKSLQQLSESSLLPQAVGAPEMRPALEHAEREADSNSTDRPQDGPSVELI